jgi:hypothetical protein
VEHALGQKLCHDITAMKDGFKGAAFKRGHIIREEDIPELLDLGKRSVFVWDELAGEVHEDDAALRLSAGAQTKRAHYEGPSEGKMRLIADERGMFRVDTNLLQQINEIGDITIATLPDHYPVEAGSALASMRIVPLTTQESQILRAETLLSERNLFELLPYAHKRIGIVITGSEIYTGRIKDRFEPVIRKKLAAYPSAVLGVSLCDDDADMIRRAAQGYIDDGVNFLIFTGGMSVDPDDITPQAIRALGASIVSHGVPSQPGNMTLVAYKNDIVILGVPGAAIHLPTTVFDVLLPAVFSSTRIEQSDLIRLAEGGLCQLCSVCHFPNCTFGRY